MFRVLIPVMLPSIVATGAYAFINAWNVYVYATAFITDKAKYTLPLALNVFQGEYGTDYGKLAAGCVIALIPVVVILPSSRSTSPAARPPVRSRDKN